MPRIMTVLNITKIEKMMNMGTKKGEWREEMGNMGTIKTNLRIKKERRNTVTKKRTNSRKIREIRRKKMREKVERYKGTNRERKDIGNEE